MGYGNRTPSLAYFTIDYFTLSTTTALSTTVVSESATTVVSLLPLFSVVPLQEAKLIEIAMNAAANTNNFFILKNLNKIINLKFG